MERIRRILCPRCNGKARSAIEAEGYRLGIPSSGRRLQDITDRIRFREKHSVLENFIEVGIAESIAIEMLKREAKRNKEYGNGRTAGSVLYSLRSV